MADSKEFELPPSARVVKAGRTYVAVHAREHQGKAYVSLAEVEPDLDLTGKSGVKVEAWRMVYQGMRLNLDTAAAKLLKDQLAEVLDDGDGS